MSKTVYKKNLDSLQWYMSQLDPDKVMNRKEEQAFGRRITQARQRAVLQGYSLAEETFLKYFLQSDVYECFLQSEHPQLFRSIFKENVRDKPSVKKIQKDLLRQKAEKVYRLIEGSKDWRPLRQILLSYNGKNKKVHALRDGLYGPRGLENEFIQRNLRFGVHRAHRGNSSMDLDDRVQEASLGLLRALDKFDFSSGNRFITYAQWWISSYFQRSPQAEGNIRVPLHFRTKMRKLAKIQEAARKYGGELTPQELERRLHVSQDNIYEMQQTSLLMYTPSLDDSLTPKKESLTYDTFAVDERPAEEIESKNLSVRLYETLQRLVQQRILSEREYNIILHRFDLFGTEEKTLGELGGVYDLTRERIRQIESKALRKLKEHLPQDFAEALK